MHEHKHSCCNHCLHHCPCCDIVYCCKCAKQWGGWQSWTYTSPVWWTNGTGYVTLNTGCSHKHEGGEENEI